MPMPIFFTDTMHNENLLKQESYEPSIESEAPATHHFQSRLENTHLFSARLIYDKLWKISLLFRLMNANASYRRRPNTDREYQ